MKRHDMRLDNTYFDLVSSCKKTVEIRLNDEKRSGIAVGDTIVFIDRADESRTVNTLVKNVTRFSSLDSLLREYPIEEFSIAEDEESLQSLIAKIYSKEKIQRFGFVAFEFGLQAPGGT